MGAPKQKWTPEEEAALRAGVEKYGPGKWRAIQKDPKFGPILASRSNVDLKDKWRNLSACQGNGRNPKVPGGLVVPGGSLIRKDPLAPMEVDPLSVFPDAGSFHVRDIPTTSNDNSPQPRYEDLILEAIATMKHPAGSSPAAISAYIEERHFFPNNRKVLSASLKSLVYSGKIIKVDQNNYKLFTGVPKPRSKESDDEKREKKAAKTKKPKMDVETAQAIIRNSEEASFTAMVAVVQAEEAALEAELAARDVERAEADVESKEIAVEVAAYHAKPFRKPRLHGPPGIGPLCNPISTQG